MPTISTRRASEAERRLDKLEQIFRKEGFRHLSVAEMAAKLHCSKRSLYELAPSKQALIALVLERRFARIRQAGWDAAAAFDTPTERTWAFLQVGTDALQEMGPKLLGDIEADPIASQMFSEHGRRRQDGIRAMIEEGVRSGDFAGYHPHLVAEVIIRSFQRMRDPSFLRELDMSAAEVWDELTRLIQNGLFPRDHRSDAGAGKAEPGPAKTMAEPRETTTGVDES